jgi:hypothetical protein
VDISFFSTLNEVRAEIGDAALPEWCITELRRQREEEERRQEAERQRREIEAAEHERRMADIARGTAKKKRDAKAIEAGEEAPKNQGLTPRQVAQRDARNIDRRAREKIGGGMSEFDAQARRYLEADRKANGAREQWIAAMIVKAEALHQMRALCPGDRDFGAALMESGITIGADDHASFLNLARLGREKMREIFTNTIQRPCELSGRRPNRIWRW